MLNFYRFLTASGKPALNLLLKSRLKRGKELQERLDEKKGLAAHARPDAPLIWVHAASIGEAQSALILINMILKNNQDLHILLTTGTVTSAHMMQKKLPERAFHQFYPLDQPEWVARFLDHWRPGLVLWMESELWPNMLLTLKEREIPAVLVNARLSERSFGRWKLVRTAAAKVLSAFSAILAQTEEDGRRFKALGAANVTVTDNLKYSARPLPADAEDLKAFQAKTYQRKIWLFASTHKGEEALACRVHQRLKAIIPGLLTVIAPRHPARREEIRITVEKSGLSFQFRGEQKNLPPQDTDIYIADTLGELGLLYRAAPISCIGRSFSDDGGGGHNPIEAAQLHSAVLHGPHVQYQQQIFDEMYMADASYEARDENELAAVLQDWLTNPEKLEEFQQNAAAFAQKKEKVINRVMDSLAPYLEQVLSAAQHQRQERA